MLNCCVAEQNRIRSLGSAVVTTPSAAAAAAVAVAPEDSGRSNDGRSGSTANVETMTVSKDVSRVAGGKGRDGGMEAGTVPETAEERSARMKASFAAERDAILRRVGVVKKREGVGSTSGGVGGGGGGRPRKHRKPELDSGLEPGLKPNSEPASSPASLSRAGRVKQNAAERADSGDGSRGRSTALSAASQGKGEDGDGGGGDEEDGGGLSRATLVEGRGVVGRGGKKRGRRAMERLGGVVRKVGGGAVRKVGSAVWKAGGAVGDGGGGGGKRIQDQGRDRSTRRTAEDVEKDGSSGGDVGRERGLDGESVKEVPSGSADATERVEAWDGVGDENAGVSVEGRGGRGDGEGSSRITGEVITGASSAVVAGGDDGVGAGGVFTGERLLATGGRYESFIPGIEFGVSRVLLYEVDGALNEIHLRYGSISC